MSLPSRSYANALVLGVAGRLDQANCDAFRADLMTQVDARKIPRNQAMVRFIEKTPRKLIL